MNVECVCLAFVVQVCVCGAARRHVLGCVCACACTCAPGMCIGVCCTCVCGHVHTCVWWEKVVRLTHAIILSQCTSRVTFWKLVLWDWSVSQPRTLSVLLGKYKCCPRLRLGAIVTKGQRAHSLDTDLTANSLAVQCFAWIVLCLGFHVWNFQI